MCLCVCVCICASSLHYGWNTKPKTENAIYHENRPNPKFSCVCMRLSTRFSVCVVTIHWRTEIYPLLTRIKCCTSKTHATEIGDTRRRCCCNKHCFWWHLETDRFEICLFLKVIVSGVWNVDVFYIQPSTLNLYYCIYIHTHILL